MLDTRLARHPAGGLWQDVTVLTYSEFGRTARENASGRTDPGTAAPVFAFGGSKIGLRPSISLVRS
ncbi:DUF1501 domain-containing protein [Cognatiyoonia sp.]|uniref:DUF1501 domain-containing protein n=1 Tax=Cognatiyoonia sp. TaxID=2211652 RepID=UPI003F69EFD7